MAAGEFNEIKALQEEIAGLADVRATIRRRSLTLEGALGEAEAELIAVRKLVGYADIELARKREVLRRLQEALQGS